MSSPNQQHWGVDQWAAFLSSKPLPCMPRSKMLLKASEETYGERLSARELADIAVADPLLCLRLLREAEARRVQRLGRETTTPLAAVMQLGTQGFRRLLLEAPEADETRAGLAECEARCYLASHLARRWSSARADIAPEEITLATLLSEMGELLLWSFAPELPGAALEAQRSGRILRTGEAQLAVCGFRFRDLSLKCAGLWHLPALLMQLIRGIDTPRANLSRICVDTARHISKAGQDDPALPADIAELSELIPGVPLSWLVEQIPGMDEEHRVLVATKAADLLNPSHA